MNKKITLLFLVLIMSLTNTNTTAFATTSDTYSISTEPLCIFDGTEFKSIQTYKISGIDDLFICAENLENYGFTVKWDAKKRCTLIDFTESKEAPKMKTELISQNGKIYKSDVKIIMNGVKTDAYNIGGYSLIAVHNLYTHNLLYSGSAPSEWAFKYVLLASYNDIFDFIYNSLDYYTAGIGGYSTHKSSINYQGEITISEFCDLMKNFIDLYKSQNSSNDTGTSISDIENMLAGTSIDESHYSDKITREKASIVIMNVINALDLPYNSNIESYFFKQENFTPDTIDSLKCVCLNQFLTLDSNDLFKPKACLSLEQTLAILCKIGTKYDIFDKLPEYDLQNAKGLERFGKTAFSIKSDARFDPRDLDSGNYVGEIYTLGNFDVPVKLPPLEGEPFNRYICKVSCTSNRLTIDFTADFGYQRVMVLGGTAFDTIQIYANDQVSTISSFNAPIKYLGNGICRVEIPLDPTLEKIDKIIVAYPTIGYLEIKL